MGVSSQLLVDTVHISERVTLPQVVTSLLAVTPAHPSSPLCLLQLLLQDPGLLRSLCDLASLLRQRSASSHPAPCGPQTAAVGGPADWLRGLQEYSHRLWFGPWLLWQPGEAPLLTPWARWPGTGLASSRQAWPGGRADGGRGRLQPARVVSLQRVSSTASC